MRVVKVTVEIQSVESLKTEQKGMEPSQQQFPMYVYSQTS